MRVRRWIWQRQDLSKGGMMRAWVVCAIALTALASTGCAGDGNPASPSPNGIAGASSLSGTAQAKPIGLTGLVRGLDLRGGSFSLITRSATYLVRMDGNTQVWSRGTQVRPTTLRDGTTVSIRGDDYGRYVLARTISIN